jgi:hypothetical protein
MKIDHILAELDKLRSDNENLVKLNEELLIKNRLWEVKFEKIKLLIESQMHLINYKRN